MTFQYVDGFDGYSTATHMAKPQPPPGGGAQVTGWLGNAETGTMTDCAINATGGPFGGRCVEIGSASTFTRHFSSPKQSISLGSGLFSVWLKMTKTGAPSGSSSIISLREGSATHLALNWTPSSNTLQLQRNTTNIGSASTADDLDDGNWHYLEFLFVISDTVGAVTVQIDQVSRITFSGDTRNANTGLMNNVSIADLNTDASNGIKTAIDDFVLSDETSIPAYKRRIWLLTPNAADASAWTPLSGANYTNVDDASVTADYNTAASSGLEDRYGVGSDYGANVVPTTVEAVVVYNDSEYSDTSVPSIQALLKSVSTTVYATLTAPGAGTSEGNINVSVYQTTDPATGSAWLGSATLNVKIGVKSGGTYGVGTHLRCYAVWANVVGSSTTVSLSTTENATQAAVAYTGEVSTETFSNTGAVASITFTGEVATDAVGTRDVGVVASISLSGEAAIEIYGINESATEAVIIYTGEAATDGVTATNFGAAASITVTGYDGIETYTEIVVAASITLTSQTVEELSGYLDFADDDIATILYDGEAATETFSGAGSPTAQVTQESVLVLTEGAPKARMTQMSVLVLAPGESNARLTQMTVLVLATVRSAALNANEATQIIVSQ